MYFACEVSQKLISCNTVIYHSSHLISISNKLLVFFPMRIKFPNSFLFEHHEIVAFELFWVDLWEITLDMMLKVNGFRNNTCPSDR